MGLFPIGENMAGALTQKGSLFWLLAFAFLLGFGTTAEDGFLAPDAESKADYAFGLRMTMAFSVGVAILLVVLLTFAAPPEIFGVAYDSGGVRTSTVTVSLVMALGLGLAATIPGRNTVINGFGLIAFASLFSIMSVLAYAQISTWRRQQSLQRNKIERWDLN